MYCTVMKQTREMKCQAKNRVNGWCVGHLGRSSSLSLFFPLLCPLALSCNEKKGKENECSRLSGHFHLCHSHDDPTLDLPTRSSLARVSLAKRALLTSFSSASKHYLTRVLCLPVYPLLVLLCSYKSTIVYKYYDYHNINIVFLHDLIFTTATQHELK